MATIIVTLFAGSALASPELTISEENEGILLNWNIPQGQVRWAVLRSKDPLFQYADTLAITSTTSWFDPDGKQQTGMHWFYRVVPWVPGSNADNFDVIEDFESGEVDLTSYPGEDRNPDAADVVNGGPGDSQYRLLLSGNTWKVQTLEPALELDSSTVWSVDLYNATLGNLQMIGFGDGEDVMSYVIWGRSFLNSDPWIPTYQGWFPRNEWVTVFMPVGEDWHGRFGDFTEITEIYYINDCDNNNNGRLYFDNLRDVTNAVESRPGVEFAWRWGDTADQDSIEVIFNNWTLDYDSDELSYHWNLGDGSVSLEEHPRHTYPRGGSWPVTLRVTDENHNWQVYTETVVDSPLTQTTDFTITCVGDIILGRGYRGIIDNYGVDYVFRNIADITSAADIAICNLENPHTLSTNGHPTKGIVFSSRPRDVEGISYAGFDFATLANNHVFDYMVQGMHDTQDALDRIGVLWGGAGDNDIQARMPTYMSRDGKSLAIICMCDRTGHYNGYQPYLDAQRNRPGFAYWNRTAIETQVPLAAENADIVMCQVHCGSEYKLRPMDGDKFGIQYVSEVPQDDDYITYELHPDTTQVKLRHYAVDNGADLVITHHPHVIQGVEVYEGKFIAHSMGNFIFDLGSNETQMTMFIEIHVGNDGVDGVIVRPGWIEDYIPTDATGDFGQTLLDYLSYYSYRLGGTHLMRYPDSDVGVVMFDTTYNRESATNDGDFNLEYFADGQYRTRPIYLEGNGGDISQIESDGADQIRYGRDIVLWANMENEGAQPWTLNTDYEFYDTEHSHDGNRSIKLNVPAGVGTASVEFQRRVRYYYDYYGDTYQCSFLGWIYTENANNAEMQIGRHSDRSGGNADYTIPVSLDGDNGWTPVYADFDQAYRSFLDVRLRCTSPGNGTAEAWFDDIAFIAWEPWETVDGNGGVDVPFPQGYRFAQVRSTESGTVNVEWTYQWPSDAQQFTGVIDRRDDNR
ncbi:MAG: CapA family protein [Candidatus Electryonea clarkiae]|nr:CapA family protein [Candidatus Electryonea clarkiae]